MRKIELFIKDDGRIVCVSTINNRERYEFYDDNLIKLYKILRSSNNILFKNNNIYYGNSDYKVVINSYRNNIDNELQIFINKIKSLYIKNKKDKLRKKKIRRVSALGGAIIITLGSYVNTFKNDNRNLNLSNINYESYEKLNTVELTFNDNFKNNDIYTENYDFDFEDRTNTEKYINTKNNYGDIISEISNEYGIDPKIMLAIATQESGEHNTLRNGPAIGLMQIEKSVWNNEDISCYNYKTNSIEKIHITEEKLKNLEFNIKVACMIFKQCLNDSKYNIPVAIQMYNYGYGNIKKAIKLYYGNNVDCENIINDNDYQWLDARNKINVGDKLYLEHVLSYVENVDDLSFKRNDDIVRCSFHKEYAKKI